MSATSIQSDIRAILQLPKEHNSNVWMLAKKLDSEFALILKLAVKDALLSATAEVKAPASLQTEEERRLALEAKLDQLIADPKTSAADIKEFRDYYGFGGKKSDTIVKVINYADVFPEGVDAVAVAVERVRIMIEEANEV